MELSIEKSQWPEMWKAKRLAVQAVRAFRYDYTPTADVAALLADVLQLNLTALVAAPLGRLLTLALVERQWGKQWLAEHVRVFGNWRELEEAALAVEGWHPRLHDAYELMEWFPKFRMTDNGALQHLMNHAEIAGVMDKLLRALQYAHEWGASDYVVLRKSYDCGDYSLDVAPYRKSKPKSHANGWVTEPDVALIYMGMVWRTDEKDWSFHS